MAGPGRRHAYLRKRLADGSVRRRPRRGRRRHHGRRIHRGRPRRRWVRRERAGTVGGRGHATPTEARA